MARKPSTRKTPAKDTKTGKPAKGKRVKAKAKMPPELKINTITKFAPPKVTATTRTTTAKPKPAKPAAKLAKPVKPAGPTEAVVDTEALATLAPQAPPLVSAIMVTGRDPQREAYVRVAVANFLAQTYRRKELIVVNDGPYSLRPLLDGFPHIQEVFLGDGRRRRRSLGELRNVGLEAARGTWALMWDDDDYCHPTRIAHQMAHRVEGKACLLNTQLRVDLPGSRVRVYTCIPGIPGTILFPRAADTLTGWPKYQDADIHEDAALFLGTWGADRHVLLDNSQGAWIGPCLHIRLFHGLNANPHGFFTGDGVFVPEDIQLGDPGRQVSEYLAGVMQREYNIPTTVRETPPAGG